MLKWLRVGRWSWCLEKVDKHNTKKLDGIDSCLCKRAWFENYIIFWSSWSLVKCVSWRWVLLMSTAFSRVVFTSRRESHSSNYNLWCGGSVLYIVWVGKQCMNPQERNKKKWLRCLPLAWILLLLRSQVGLSLHVSKNRHHKH